MSEKPRSYVLSMFPYPSGTLHMGHLRVYTISDVISRYKRMTGHDVLHPMGWDAFGLPAENAALERGIHPGDWTMSNISKMKGQLQEMGGQFDWDKEFMTCSPSFYKHTQRIFLMLYERGLAYQAEAMVNYDPVDKTVLANEQVDLNGCSWRSGAKVRRIMLRQWFLRITVFQNDLLGGINSLLEQNAWPERVLTQQKHWLGKSEGARVKFAITGDHSVQENVRVYTTRPDTLFGVQFLALSLNHPIVQEIAKANHELQVFIKAAADLPPETKAGFRLPSIHASNPLVQHHSKSFDHDTSLPVFVAPYVLDEYGEGAVMGVPAHDTRDWAFWSQHGVGVPPKAVIAAGDANPTENSGTLPTVAYTQKGVLTAACGEYAGLDSVEGGQKIVGELFGSGDADVAQNWRLRDWLISRQRYWGTPIPIIHCDSCGAVPVPIDQLPVELPDLAEMPPGTTGNPLEHIPSFVNTTCPKCHGSAKRDTDTMDTFVDSSWYYMRFPDAQNSAEPFSSASATTSLPVDIYVGGVEHAILHLLYARFIYKFLASEGLIPEGSTKDDSLIEPFRQVISQGMVHGKTFSDPATGRFLHPSEVEFDIKGSPIMKSSGVKPNISYEKMSKSKHNGVDPSTCITKYGADATRAHMLFSAPVSEVLEWDEEKIVGVQRWFARITRLVEECSSDFNTSPPAPGTEISALNLTNPSHLSDQDIQLLLTVNDTINSITRTFTQNIYALNTTISDLIKLTNAIASYTTASETSTSSQIKQTALSILLRLLAPIAPQTTSQHWQKLFSSDSSISDTAFPTPLFTPQMHTFLLNRRQTMTCAVQINGKLRFSTDIPLPTTSGDASSTGPDKAPAVPTEEYLIEKLLETEQGRVWLKEKHDVEKRRRCIVVRGGKVVNFVF